MSDLKLRVERYQKHTSEVNLRLGQRIEYTLSFWGDTKDLALDRSAWKTAIHVPEP